MNQEIPFGYCHCGCGQKTTIAPYTSKKDKWIKGMPLRFVKGHQSRGRFNPHMPDKNAYYRRFGSFKNALKEAGLLCTNSPSSKPTISIGDQPIREAV